MQFEMKKSKYSMKIPVSNPCFSNQEINHILMIKILIL